MPDIFQVWENENFDTPMIEEQFHPNRTILTLPLSKRNVTIKSDDKKSDDKKDVTSKTQTYQQAILDIWKQVWNIV